MALTSSPEANYLTRDNIIYPSPPGTQANATVVTALEAKARVEIQTRTGIAATGGAIKR